MLGLWKVREIADKVTNVVMNYTEIEAKVREATNDEAWGPTGQLMQEVAQATFTYEQFPEVMGMLWKRMLGERKNWRRTYKSLLLLNYLIKNGSERVVTSAREHLYDLRGLENYTCVDEQGKDQGVNIRHKVKEMVDFIQDDDKLREERKKAKKNKDKYVGMSNDTLGMGMGYRGGGGGGGGASGGSWEEAPRRRNDDFSDWDSNRGNGSSRRKNDDDNSSDISADEATDRRDISSGIESKPSGRFGGEFRDSDEPIKRQDKEFKFDIDKSKSTSAKSTKKIDLGAAAFYKVEPTPATAPNPVTQSTNDNGSSDLLADVFGNPGNATTTTSSAAASILDDFDPRGVDSGANGDFGDFSSAFSSQAAPQASASDSFANFGAVFDSTITAAPQAATPSQDAFLLDDLLAPAPAEPSSSPFHAFSTNVMPQGSSLQPVSLLAYPTARPQAPLAPSQPNRMGGVNSGRTWSDVGGLNINIDNLSLTGKPRNNAPSMNQLANSGPTSPQPMLITNAAPASMPFMPHGMVAPMPMMNMNPRPMGIASPMAPNPYVGGANMSGFTNNPAMMPTMLASPNGVAPHVSTPFHPAFGK
ncbi:clathrin interactor 1 isoform X4 [Daphnia magna]|uniref:clathrin interactor 1 isoform X4 n=1 Tax=Daphnia magna TaxID=35525 RepID=UPI001E1BCED7|nr:clathrin interactor 1 isoform X4 [Daphnia magna]